VSAIPRRVRKRDGRVVPFDARKITDAIEKAFVACGSRDRAIADELAQAVVLTLSRSLGSGNGGAASAGGSDRAAEGASSGASGSGAAASIPTIEEIQDLVERVLMETGHTAVAKAYILYRERRSQIRETLAVRRPAAPGERTAPAAGTIPSSSTTSGLQATSLERNEPWSKGKIVAALMMEAELPRELAEDVAARVERRVFASGMRIVSTALLRELVDNELFERGLQTHLRRQSVVGLPKYDLREGLRTGFFRETWGRGELVASSAQPEWTIARTVLGKFASEEVLPPAVAEKHLSGDLHFDGLESPYRDCAGGISLGGLRRRAFPALSAAAAPSDFSEGLDGIRELLSGARRAVAGTLVLSEIEEWLAPWIAAAQLADEEEAMAQRTSMAERFLRALTLGRERASGAASDGELCLALAGENPWAIAFVAARARCAEMLGRAASGLPAIVLLPPPVMHRREGVAALADLPGSEPIARAGFGSFGEVALAPGVRRHADDSGVLEPPAFVTTGGVAHLNLPRLAYRAGSWSEGKLLESVSALVDDAVAGLAAMQETLAQTASARGAEMPTPRRSFGLAVIGLRECVRRICDGAVEPNLARSIVQILLERSRAVSAARGIRVFVEPWIGGSARSRFERLDARAFADSTFFADGDRVRYSPGMTLSPVPGTRAGAAEGEALVGVEAGVLPAAESMEETWAFAHSFATTRQRAAGGAPSVSAPMLRDAFPRGPERPTNGSQPPREIE